MNSAQTNQRKLNYSNQIVARVLLETLPTGIVTSLLVTVTVPLLAVTAETKGPLSVPTTTFEEDNLSCFAVFIAL